MQAFPHHYRAGASGKPGSNVLIKAANLPELVSAAPAEFGGPGDQWSPEELLEKSEAGCLITNSMTADTHLEAEVACSD